ncbi:MAG: 30S ribosomal protein S3 [Bacillota bacterium]
MGQKIHPKGLRLGIVKDWDATWYAKKEEYINLLHEDIKVRDLVKATLPDASIARVVLERAANRLKVTIHTAKPGMVIGRQGSGVEALRQKLEAFTGKQVSINIVEIKHPEVDATLVAENIAQALERRISHRRAMRQAIQRAMRMGAKGIRVMVSGRIGGAEIARREGMKDGSVPLHTLRADIDYGMAEASTTYGRIGVKVWIYRGQVLPQAKRRAEAEGGR